MRVDNHLLDDSSTASDLWLQPTRRLDTPLLLLDVSRLLIHLESSMVDDLLNVGSKRTCQ
jgi:hypothetical protein